jgi:hypothetical protein
VILSRWNFRSQDLRISDLKVDEAGLNYAILSGWGWAGGKDGRGDFRSQRPK